MCGKETIFPTNIFSIGPGIYLAIVNIDFRSSFFFLCSLLFTNVLDTDETDYLGAFIFWSN